MFDFHELQAPELWAVIGVGYYFLKSQLCFEGFNEIHILTLVVTWRQE
jgi:hypothetical protein